MTISSLLMVGYSNTGCSSIISVRSALEGSLTGNKREEWREEEREVSEDNDEEERDPLLEREPSLRILGGWLAVSVWLCPVCKNCPGCP